MDLDFGLTAVLDGAAPTPQPGAVAHHRDQGAGDRRRERDRAVPLIDVLTEAGVRSR